MQTTARWTTRLLSSMSTPRTRAARRRTTRLWKRTSRGVAGRHRVRPVPMLCGIPFLHSLVTRRMTFAATVLAGCPRQNACLAACACYHTATHVLAVARTARALGMRLKQQAAEFGADEEDEDGEDDEDAAAERGARWGASKRAYHGADAADVRAPHVRA